MGLPRMQHLVGLLLDDASPSPMEIAAEPVDVGSHAFGGSLVVVVVTADVVGGAANVLTESTAAGIAELAAGVRVGLLLLLHLVSLDHCSDWIGVPTSFFFFSFLENVRQFF